MMCRDLIVCLRETAISFAPKQAAKCFSNLPCECPHPGQETQCEECPYLEACLSRCKPAKMSQGQSKIVTGYGR
jgi:hypothetical protein